MKYQGYADFQAAHTLAKYAAYFELGPYWKLVRGASVRARLPATWVRCPVSLISSGAANGPGKSRVLRYSKSPRDIRLPAACFWEHGLPEGPEYFAEYAWETALAPLQYAEAAD